MSTRPENESYAALLTARMETKLEWPEPETTALYRVLVRGANRIVSSTLGHREPELASEIATRALLNLGSTGRSPFSGFSQFSTWFYRVAHNECIRRVTEGAPREEQFSEDFEPQVQAGLPVRLPRALSKYEQCLLRLVLRGETLESIADSLKCSRATIYRRWNRLKLKLGDVYGYRA